MQTSVQTSVAPAQRVVQLPAAPLSVRLPAPRRAELRHNLTCKATVALVEAGVSDPEDGWNRTYYPTGKDVANETKPWYIVDAEGQTLGRLATLVAMHIRGKHLPTYSPSMDMGGYVIVINADKVQVTGRKTTDKIYRRHTNGRPGTMKEETFDKLQKRLPERIIEKAVYGMLPKGRLGNGIRLHLKTYKGPNHPHEAQQPVDITHKINQKPKAGQ